MNTVENIVEAYYRLCEKSFTMRDVKVLKGNNRQFDLLVVQLGSNRYLHVEIGVSVNDDKPLQPKVELKAIEDLKRKFFGAPRRKDGIRTEFARNRHYKAELEATYKDLGLDPQKVQRVYCRWTLDEERNEKLARFLKQKGIQFLSFRDKVLPSLDSSVATAHYDDDALRLISLLKQWSFHRRRNERADT